MTFSGRKNLIIFNILFREKNQFKSNFLGKKRPFFLRSTFLRKINKQKVGFELLKGKPATKIVQTVVCEKEKNQKVTSIFFFQAQNSSFWNHQEELPRRLTKKVTLQNNLDFFEFYKKIQLFQLFLSLFILWFEAV